MRMYSWDSFDTNFPKKPIFRYMIFEELGFEFVFQTGDLRRIKIMRFEEDYLIENMGGGYFKVNDGITLFNGQQLHEYLTEVGKDNILHSLKIKINAMKNRFMLLSQTMERIA